MNIFIYIIFILTYLLIASRRLALLPIGRPAGALVGAVLMVIIGALTPEESYSSIDHNTIILLFGTMVITIYLESAGFFEWLAGYVLSITKTPLRFLLTVSLISGLLSALMVNDTVCFFLTPTHGAHDRALSKYFGIRTVRMQKMRRSEIARHFGYVPQKYSEETLTVFDAVLLGRKSWTSRSRSCGP